MNALWALWQSTIGKKAVMAVTGLVWVLYLIGHVLGNLLVFGGPKLLNGYAATLHEQLPAVLWTARVILIASVVLHVAAATQLAARARAARPVGYLEQVPRAATWASRSMRWGGVLIAAFLVFHLLHLTTGTIRPVPYLKGDLYGTLVGGFRVGWVVAIYLVSMVAIGLHLFHGDWAWLRSLGLARPASDPLRRPLAALVAGFVLVGFTLIPLVIFFGGLR